MGKSSRSSYPPSICVDYLLGPLALTLDSIFIFLIVVIERKSHVITIF